MLHRLTPPTRCALALLALCGLYVSDASAQDDTFDDEPTAPAGAGASASAGVGVGADADADADGAGGADTRVAGSAAAGTTTERTGSRAATAASTDDALFTEEEYIAATGEANRANGASGDTRAPRAYNSWFGATGGLHVVDAGSGAPGTLRLQLGADFSVSSNWLLPDDLHGRSGGTLSGSFTFTDYLELYASVQNYANWNDRGDRITGESLLLQVVGDAGLGLKAYHAVLPYLDLGGDLRLGFLNAVGGLGLKAVNVGLRANATADLRRLPQPKPFILRTNFEYLFDNSAKLIADHEDAVYARLPNPQPRESEDRHLTTRVERLGLGVNRADMFTMSFGGEVPLEVAEGFFIHPLFEYQLGIPVNRQGYSCLLVTTDASRHGEDGCLDIQGLAAMPSTLTLGARVLPPVRGLGVLLGLDIGLTGTEVFVRELKPNRRWAMMGAVSYNYDTHPPAPAEPTVVVREVAREVAAPPRPRISGLVVEAGAGTVVPWALVRYPNTTFTAQASGPDGRFVSYGFDPGQVQVEISHPEYESRVCVVDIPATPAPAPRSGPIPVHVPTPGAGADAGPDTGSTAAEPASPPADEPPMVELRCELTARPRVGSVRGSVMDTDGNPVPGAKVAMRGPGSHDLVSDASGAFTAADLQPGNYALTVDAEGYLLQQGSVTVSGGAEASAMLRLQKKPKKSLVRMSKREVKIRRQIQFRSGSAEILERSFELMSEIADVLLRNPQLRLVEVQGHTDNRGGRRANLQLSQERAESVVQWLVQHGVSASRLQAKGYGDSHPLVPNLTAGNRAKNRRVQFIIKEQ